MDLNPGQEWYSTPFYLSVGGQVRFFGAGTVRFYLGVFDTYRVNRIVNPPGNIQRGPFPFQFGSDRQSWDSRFQARVGGTYQVVARLGVFNPPGRIRVGAGPIFY